MKKTYVIIGLIFSALYLFYYLLGRPLWLDECLLALAITEVDYVDLFLPLPYQQVAPPLFLIIAKAMYQVKEIPVEYRLRFFSLICGIGSVWIFIPFIKKFIQEKSLILIAYLLFCSSLWIPSYAQEFKQYGPDIFLGMVAFLLCDWILKQKNGLAGGFILGILGLLSHTTIFVVLACLGGFVLCQIKKLSVECIIKVALIAIGWVIPVAVMIYFMYYHSPNLVHMNDGWQTIGGFIDGNLSAIYHLFVKNINYLFLLSRFKLYWIFGPLILWQLIFIKEKGQIRFENAFLSVLFFGILLASFLKLYPAAERTILWTYPFIIVVIMRALERIKQYRITHIFHLILMVIVCCYIGMNGAVVDPIEEEVPNAILELKHHPEIIPVYMKRFIKYKGVKNVPDHGAVYTFYKKEYRYQPKSEVILEDGYTMITGLSEQCQQVVQGKFEAGKKYGLIAFEDKLSPECQEYFLTFGGEMMGPVYVWTHPEKE